MPLNGLELERISEPPCSPVVTTNWRSDLSLNPTPGQTKGQVTVPKACREALGINEGDEIVFRVEGNRAVLARTPDCLELARTLGVPATKRNVAWDEVIRRTRAVRAPARQ